MRPLAASRPATRAGSRAPSPRRPRRRRCGWPHDRARRVTRCSSRRPARGKTLAAFLACARPLDAARRAAGRSRRCACSTSRRSRRWRYDVERNLRAPLAGIARAAARRAATRCSCRASACAPATRRAGARAQLARSPADILITTPESLYLLLTLAGARDARARSTRSSSTRSTRSSPPSAARTGAVARAAGER